jgi:uncharacterized protein (DUF2147 family)
MLKYQIKRASQIILISMCLLPAVAFAGYSPVGYWVATSPFFYGRPLAVVKTYLTGKELCGEIVKVIPLNGSSSGFEKMAKSGPVMMCGYHEDRGEWVGGKIYEQTTAKIYASTVSLSKDGRQLYVRGYRGPFYRTVRWDRIR